MIPTEVLDELKCDHCQGYLSYPPIYLTEDGKNICGRCPQPAGKLSRNSVYERLATTVSFPCPVRTCLETCSILEMKAHEDLVHGMTCPILPKGGCEWSGTVSHLYRHFINEHEEFLAENPFVGKPKDGMFENCLLMKAFGFLFAINVDYNGVKLRHYCRLLDNSGLCGLFEGALTLRGTVGSIRKVRRVGAIGEAFEKRVVIENNLKSVFATVGGDYEDLRVDFEVKMKEERCVECDAVLKEAPVHLRDGSYFCGVCGRDLKNDDAEDDDSDYFDSMSRFENEFFNALQREFVYRNCLEPVASTSAGTATNAATSEPAHATGAFTCKFSGCAFRTDDAKGKNRHEAWLCEQAGAKCEWGCSETLRDVNLFDHYKTRHLENAIFTENAPALSICCQRVVKTNEWYTGSIEMAETVFLYRHRIEAYFLNVSIMSKLPVEALPYYKFEIGVCELWSDSEIVYRLKSNNWQVQAVGFDYHLSLRKKFFCIDEDRCYVSIKIYKIRDINRQLVKRSMRDRFNCKYFFMRGCSFTNSVKNNVMKHDEHRQRHVPLLALPDLLRRSHSRERHDRQTDRSRNGRMVQIRRENQSVKTDGPIPTDRYVPRRFHDNESPGRVRRELPLGFRTDPSHC